MERVTQTVSVYNMCECVHLRHELIGSYRRVPAHRIWQIKTAVWNVAGFLHCALETCWQRFGQFLNDFLNDFLFENLNFLCENLRFSL